MDAGRTAGARHRQRHQPRLYLLGDAVKTRIRVATLIDAIRWLIGLEVLLMQPASAIDERLC
ncbi:hypothetical protein D3C87_1853370 [compost metagenome]